MSTPEYTYDHSRPAVTVDLAIVREICGEIELLLIKRLRDPFAGAWALPGGFVDEHEPLDDAAHRELLEETGLQGVTLRQFGAYGDPGRDPRGHTITIVYFGLVDAHTAVRAGDDASDVEWFPAASLPELAFDHHRIIADVLGAREETTGSARAATPAPGADDETKPGLDEGHAAVGVALRLTTSQRERVWRQLSLTIEDYFADVDALRVIPEMNPAPVREAVRSIDLDRGNDAERLIETVVGDLRRYQLHVAHRSYFGLFNPSPTTMGIAGDALAAAFNPQLAAWSHSPLAIEIERRLIDEIGRIFGYSEGERDGTFASGGAEANHTALLCALVSAFPEFAAGGARALAGEPSIYVTSEAHHSTLKAARMSGLGTASVRMIATTDDLRMDVDHLREAVAEDRRAGRVPLMVVATAGTTGAGVIDPLGEVADLAEAEGLWMHADAAWGGAAMLVDEMRPCFEGIARADSITFDAHKWLSVPMGAGVFLTRHGAILDATFATQTGYMPREAEGLDVLNPYAHSMQWSRRFIGLKVFLSVAAAGWAGYAVAIRHQVRMGEELRTLLRKAGWEIVNRTPLPVVCFRGDGRLREHQAEWLERVVARVVSGGRAWVSSTRVGELSAIRACITNFETDVSDLERLVALLGEIRQEV